MADVGYLLGGLMVLGFTVNGLLWKVGKPSRKFLSCWKCHRKLEQKPVPNVLPDAVIRYLDKHELTTPVVSRYEYPRRCYRLWYIPRFGQVEKAFFLKEEM
jgi:hypothetical protein